MRIVVADASVLLKVLLATRGGEADTDAAMLLWHAVKEGHLRLHQPPHWLAEMGATLARLSPATALQDIDDLYEMRVAVLESRSLFQVACALSIELGHHLFDTLYHAVALELGDATLVTADERYYRKARVRGRIIRLADFDVSS